MNANRTVLVKERPSRPERWSVVARSSRERRPAALASPAPVSLDGGGPAILSGNLPSLFDSVAPESGTAAAPENVGPKRASPKRIELSPADAALRARRRLCRRFAAAGRNAEAQARLSKADIYETLGLAYGAVRAWKRRGKAGEIKRHLRREASATIGAHSSPFLVLLRSALPDLPAKRASKWAAAMELADRKGVPRREFVEFVENQGGIEGAARKMARLRALAAEGWLR